MKALKFELSGKTAIFKKPDVNSYAYFTYNNVHKIALLGILGAILGLGGYNQQNRELRENNRKTVKSRPYIGEEPSYPEFYQKLKDLKLSIFPRKGGYFTKKIQVFNNSVGYASKEEGGNLIVREQWLENPAWTIYLLDDGTIDRYLYDKLMEYTLENRCEFMPYLGKNDHIAQISGGAVVELEKGRTNYISSLFINENVKMGRFPYDDDQPLFFFKEVAPYKMNREYNFYQFKEFVMTNLEISNVSEMENVFTCGNDSLSFF